MRILIVAATDEEIENVRTHFTKLTPNGLAIEFLVTGVGMTATAYCLTKRLATRKFDMAINIGLAGSYRYEIVPGDVVNVISETFGDLGAEDDDKFLSVFELGLQHSDHFPFWNEKLKNDTAGIYKSLKSLKKVKAITVNKVHGNNDSIMQAIMKFHPDIETMEGAAFFYVCMMEKIPCIQLRAISNRVEKRDRNSWEIILSIANLSQTVRALIDELKN